MALLCGGVSASDASSSCQVASTAVDLHTDFPLLPVATVARAEGRAPARHMTVTTLGNQLRTPTLTSHVSLAACAFASR